MVRDVLLCLLLVHLPSASQSLGSNESFPIDEQSLAPLATGILKFDPVNLGSSSPSTATRFPLVLAEKRTRRPDVLQKFRPYVGGWNITNKHYWASVGYTGTPGFVLAFLWFVSYGLALILQRYLKCGININNKGSPWSNEFFLVLLLIFTCIAGTGCILLSIGQDGVHEEVLNTIKFVVNQSEFTVQILRNVTEYLSLAKAINVEEVILPVDVQEKINKLNAQLDGAASTLSDKTRENSSKTKKVLGEVRCALIVVVAIMLFLTMLGLLLLILGRQHAIYMFVLSGWLLVACTFVICGIFIVLNNAVSDTCMAMVEWVDNPHAETALSNILPCVDEKTSNQTFFESREVVRQLVNVVNTAINTVANANGTQLQSTSYFYNQSGPLMPPLCHPPDSLSSDRECELQGQGVSLANASSVWLNYTCMTSTSGLCAGPGRVTPDIHRELVSAVNATYALDHYTPLLLSLRNCSFVRDTFNTITSHYCPGLDLNLTVVTVGLGIISAGIMLCLILWILHANHPKRGEVFVPLTNVNIASDGNKDQMRVFLNGTSPCNTQRNHSKTQSM